MLKLREYLTTFPGLIALTFESKFRDKLYIKILVWCENFSLDKI